MINLDYISFSTAKKRNVEENTNNTKRITVGYSNRAKFASLDKALLDTVMFIIPKKDTLLRLKPFVS